MRERVLQRYLMASVSRVAARYKEKKQVRSEDGGKTTVYVYSERQIADRNRKKAERLQKLGRAIKKIRAKVQKDLKSSDPETALTALAVALMDETAERIGSEASAAGNLNNAGDGHFGVSTWKKSHVSFSNGNARLRYVGKSGVKHDKRITNPAIVRALKEAYETCKDENLFCYDSGKISGETVNSYLKNFNVTSKDIRGYHANVAMRETLRSIRSKGGKLPTDTKEREKQLKDEFKEGLEYVADEVGHTSSTLSAQYLTPGLEEKFLATGEVMEGMR